MPANIRIVPVRRLTLSEFESVDTLPNNWSASTKFGHYYKYKRKQIIDRYYPEDIVITVRIKKAAILKSIKETATPMQLAGLLKHEHGHVDIANLGARGIKSDVESLWASSPEALEKKINYTVTVHKNRMEKIHDLYDNQTKHGSDREPQVRWNNLIDAAIKNTKASTIAGLKF